MTQTLLHVDLTSGQTGTETNRTGKGRTAVGEGTSGVWREIRGIDYRDIFHFRFIIDISMALPNPAAAASGRPLTEGFGKI